MSKIINFIKTTAIGGLLVIVPIAIILFVLAQIFYSLYSATQSLSNDLGLQIDTALIVIGIAAASLIGLCFLTGLIVQTRVGIALQNWMKRNVGKRIPMYGAISGLTKRFAGLEGKEFAPVEIDLYGSRSRVIGFLVELLPDDRCAVFVPSAPVATVGKIYIVDTSSISKLDSTVADTLTAVTQWGVGSSDLYQASPNSSELENR